MNILLCTLTAYYRRLFLQSACINEIEGLQRQTLHIQDPSLLCRFVLGIPIKSERPQLRWGR